MIYDAVFHSCAPEILGRLSLTYFQLLCGIKVRRKVELSGTVLQGPRRKVEKHAFHFKCNSEHFRREQKNSLVSVLLKTWLYWVWVSSQVSRNQEMSLDPCSMMGHSVHRRALFPSGELNITPPPKKNNSSATPKWSQRNQLAEKLRHPTLKSQVHDLQAWITFSGPRSRYQTHAGPGSVFTLTYLGNGNFRFLPLSKVPGINTCACCWVTGQQKPPEGNQIWEEEGQLQNNTFLLKDPNGIANWCYHSTGLRLSEFISLRSFQ